ncbi:ATP-dependent Clp protease ATP-binding subunit [Mycolicibacterium boenickei]|uniref:ATP-dependent Clp protease ATP-binding subunit n=1 Tax=Mycolicibacterium boenickei TaxID=146017 RepID=A0AAX2ZU17_9MYCO|nr:AAA family ATPase [Mycolicibacterium boenickei]PEG62381.1 ATP-dependent Clp protease ATP-binding subunit [Mycolicibacterium boenickei]UNB98636.1 ATP-dependent Clp protease ATP-binding subunit [Mycolicibacterium boenickei]BBX94482.1 ATP-dependent protease ATP-binding subunit-like protein AmiB [Mycolicibacterium boenickei]
MPYLTDMYHEQNRNSIRVAEEPAAQVDSAGGFDPDELSRKLNAAILGQRSAVDAVVRAVSIAHIGVADPGRPLSSVLLVGPTGVGKTELVRQVAAALRTGPDDMCRIDMSALAQEHYAASLSGAPPGYAGSKESFTLFDKAKIEGGPYLPGVVLFDEVEKADATVLRALLHVLDTGELRLANGQQKISFRNSYIFLTSNLGSLEAAAMQRSRRRRWRRIGRRPAAKTADLIREAVESFFDPEFFNRIDEMVVFDEFDDDTAESVTRKEIHDLVDRLKRRGVRLQVADDVIEFVRRKGFDPVYGARGLRRAIRTELAEPVAHTVLTDRSSRRPLAMRADLVQGDQVFVCFVDAEQADSRP